MNEEGLDFYDRLIDGMLERGLSPTLTLYHWDLPSPLADHGGWMNRDIAGWFADYARVVWRASATALHATATINEPWCVACLSHFLGVHAPGYRDIRAAARAMHHVLLAHGTGVDALRGRGFKNLGIVLNLAIRAGRRRRARSTRGRRGWMTASSTAGFSMALFKGSYPADVLKGLGPHLPARWQDDMALISNAGRLARHQLLHAPPHAARCAAAMAASARRSPRRCR